MISYIFKIFLLSRLVFFAFALVAIYLLPLDTSYIGKQFDPLAPYLVWIWANFDGRHFLDIATLGYQGSNFAFFPLYPLLIFLVNLFLSIPPVYSGIVISSVSLFLSFVMIYKIIRLDFKEDVARLSLIFLALFPLAFFYHSVYSDSLFLLFSTTSFFFARLGGQKNWIFAGIFGGLSVLTRFSGIALIPALMIEWYLQNKKTKFISVNYLKTGFLAVFITSMGLIIYMIYLQIFFGDWLLFQKSFSAWSQQKLILPPQTLFRYLKILLFANQNTLVYWIAFLEFICIMFYFGLSIYVLKKVRISYGVFMIVLLSLVVFTGTFAGTPRYILHLFPGFLAMSILLSKKRNLKIMILIIFIILGLIFTSLFTRGYFIT